MPIEILCAIYCRFSSRQQEGGYSIEAQKSACLEYAQRQNWKVHRIYEDKALSGTSDERDSFQEMISAAGGSPPPFTVIMVHKLDRFARNRYDSIKYKYLLRKNGVRVVSATQPIVGSNDPTEVLVESLLEGIDEFYSLNLARESIKGMVENVKAGFWNGGFAPYGFRLVKVNHKGRDRRKLETDPREAEIVRYIYRRYSEAKIGVKALAIELNSKGFRSRTGRYFHNGTVENILRNEKYIGDTTFGKKLNWKDRPIKPLPEAITVRDTHPGIVSRELQDKVLKILALRNPREHHPRIHNSSYLLSSLITCSKCGARYVGASAKSGKFHYYRCGNKAHKGNIACNAPDFNRDRLETQIIDQLKEHIVTKENIRKLAIELFKSAKEASPDIAKRIRGLDSECRGIKNKLNRLYEVLETSHNLNADDLAPRIRELKSRAQETQSRKDIMEDEFRIAKEAKLEEKFITAYAELLIGSLESNDFFTRKQYLLNLIERIEIKKDSKCEITYRPFAGLPGASLDPLPARRGKPVKNQKLKKKLEFALNANWLPPLGSIQNYSFLTQKRVFVHTFMITVSPRNATRPAPIRLKSYRRRIRLPEDNYAGKGHIHTRSRL